jgi:Holliday junction resolvasome RuvABC endonuclease subunit
MSNLSSCVMGIDLSLTSPGIAVYEYTSDLWYFYGFNPWTRRCINFEHPYIQLFPKISKASNATNAVRFREVIDTILGIVGLWKNKYPDLLVGLEGYAFGKDTAHAFKLMELGGILKYRLFFDLDIICKILPPTCWKKHAVGDGRADKLDVALFMTLIIKLDLFTIFHLPKRIKVDHPIEDMYDASGIVQALRQIQENNIDIVPKKKPKKLKKTKTDPEDVKIENPIKNPIENPMKKQKRKQEDEPKEIQQIKRNKLEQKQERKRKNIQCAMNDEFVLEADCFI